MTLTDIIALAKQGYKPGDIKELIEIAKTAEHEDKTEPPVEPAKTEPPVEPAKTEPPVDYTAEIEKLKAENEKIKSDLAKAQEMNRTASNPDDETESDDEIIKNMVLSFMR